MSSLLVLGVLVIVALVIGSVLLKVVFGLLGWLIIGLIAGFLANMFMKSRGGDLIYNIVLGVLGSLLSGFLLSLVGLGRLDNGFIPSLIFSTLGAMLLIWLGRMFTANKPPTLPRY